MGLARVSEDNNKAHCKLCKIYFCLSSMGKAVLISHQMKSKKHLTYMKNMSALLTSPKPKSSSGHKSSASNEANTSKDNEGSKQQSTLEVIVNNSDKLKAEIICALKSVYSGYSYNLSKDMSSLFHTMFPDSKIAKGVTNGTGKIRYVINFGIAPIFKSMLLVEPIKLSECYVVCFDESLNNETQNCEMDVLIRFFDVKGNKVKTCYLDSEYLGHSMHSDLIRDYNEAV